MDKMLDLSPRQVCRLKARLRQLGPEGITHGNTGCTPANAKPERLRARVISLYHDEFYDYNLAHFTKTLAEEYGINLGYETVRHWLRREELGTLKHHFIQHRRRRERRAQFGELVFLDGSPHRWFGPDQPPATLKLGDTPHVL